MIVMLLCLISCLLWCILIFIYYLLHDLSIQYTSWNLFMLFPYYVFLGATRVVYTQLMVTWDTMCVCMTVFLFRLSPRRTNLLNPENKLVQLVLPTFVFNTLLDACITCLHNLSAWHTSRYTYVCMCTPLGFILRAYWATFLTTPGPACSDPRAWIVVDPSRGILCAAEAW